MKDRIYTWSDALGYYADIHGEMCEADEVVAASDARELMTGLENEIEVLRFAGDVQGERLTAEIERLLGLLREAYDGRQSPMAFGLAYRIGHTLNHSAADQPDTVPRAEYDRLQSLVTAQGLRLMETEDQPDAVCNWRADADWVWTTDCGEQFCLADDPLPSLHSMKFCHGCGKPIREHPYVEPPVCGECGEDLVGGACPECTAEPTEGARGP